MKLIERINQAKACIFDMDGTLVDSLSIWNDIDETFFHERGMEVPKDYDKTISHMSFMEMAIYTKETYGIKESPEQICQIWSDMSKKAYQETIKVKDGVIPFLEYLKKRGMPMSLATTNKEELYLPCLKRNHVDIYFDHIENVNRLNTTKREPKIYLELSRRMEAKPEETLVFEDILTAIKTAKSASFKVIGVYDRQNQADWNEIKSISDDTIDDYRKLILSDRFI